MASAALNLARWSALGLGILYGWTHHRSLVHAEQKRKEEEAYKHKQELIEKARAAYAAKISVGSDVIKDPNDPRFDLEKLLTSVEKSA
ncbi:12381_t:CDS:2 [Ambispora gerdemannii]|uniref:ATP synthase F(0) complex subunit e, mitochondrial n=1 Tax=Ambispora gerdemannii TaxID=144530 RepID=A0A9N8V1Z4_9GLOM|nr:12381_t:CDS:2 [Ambispora gerdemannii]